MKPYKKTYQEYWMSTDIKPKGKDKQMIQQQTRAQLKRELLKEVKDVKVRP